MKHAKETIFTQLRCTRRVVLTFPHFISETGKQISTYHQGCTVNNDSKSVFLLFLQGTQKSVSRSVLFLSTYMMLERFGDNLTVTTSDILSSRILRVSVAAQSISGVPGGTIA